MSVQLNLFVRAVAGGEEMYGLSNAVLENNSLALLRSITLRLPRSVIENHSEIRFVHLPCMEHIFS